MELDLVQRTYRLRRRFTIRTGSRDTVDVVEARISDGGDTGRGETVPAPRVTGVDVDDVDARVRSWWRTRPGDDPPAEPAFAGLDAALLDLRGRRDGAPVHEIMGLPAARRPTSVTVSLDTPDAMVAEARDHVEAGFDRLKVKVGEGKADVERVRALTEALPGATICVDANGGWSPDQAQALVPALADLGVELVEQPLPRGAAPADAGIDGIVPLYADESVVARDDLDALPDGYDGVVAKIDKHGGPRPTRTVLEAARDRGLATMIGCMVGSSLSIAAGAHLLALVDEADLDGAWLLADDGYAGVPLDDGVVATPDGPGLGVTEGTT